MNRLPISAFIFLFLLMTSIMPAQAQKATKWLRPLRGEWTSADPAFGFPAHSTMQWSLALDGKFSRLNYRIEMQTGDGSESDENATAVFEGVAYYQFLDPFNLRAFWADSSGDLHPISADWDGEALVADWGRVGEKQGRTRYELIKHDEMAVTDWIKTDEGWRQFNHSVFRRQAVDKP